VHLALTPEQEKLQDELRAYFAELVTPEIEAEMAGGEMGGDVSQAAVRKLGADGWLGIGWPKEYGGQGASAIEQYIFYNEAQRAGAPVPFLTINAVAPTIMKFGTQAQKDFFLPRILRGECNFAIGYSEPGAGTDLASLTTKAVRDGDEWVINGQKIFTSLANIADYIWLAARTNPEVKKHKGISIFAVPTDTPGFTLTPIRVMGGARTNATYYDDVRVPHDALIGDVDHGWDLIVNQLNFERIALGPPAYVERQYGLVLDWARQTGKIDEPWVQLNLARVRAKLEFLRLINWKMAWATERDEVNPAEASATKVFASEFYTEAYRLLMEILGPAGALKRGSPEAAVRGSLERAYQGTLVLTFGGGTNEVQRDLISIFGLGMPRSV
jgi:alkylation response protein AidB-like acyl-CoA dehydrogenase